MLKKHDFTIRPHNSFGIDLLEFFEINYGDICLRISFLTALVIKVAILISGRGSNMEAILRAILSGKLKGVEVEVVISDNPESRGLAIASDTFRVPTKAIPANGLRGWDYDRKIVEALEQYGIYPKDGLVCLAGFMRILSPEFVNRYKKRIINIHPSLLPSFPGLHAQRKAIAYGVKVSGCTIHFIDEGVDSGPILLQKAITVLDSDSEETLSSRILIEEHKLYTKALKLIAQGKVYCKGRRVILIKKNTTSSE